MPSFFSMKQVKPIVVDTLMTLPLESGWVWDITWNHIFFSWFLPLPSLASCAPKSISSINLLNLIPYFWIFLGKPNLREKRNKNIPWLQTCEVWLHVITRWFTLPIEHIQNIFSGGLSHLMITHRGHTLLSKYSTTCFPVTPGTALQLCQTQQVTVDKDPANIPLCPRHRALQPSVDTQI